MGIHALFVASCSATLKICCRKNDLACCFSPHQTLQHPLFLRFHVVGSFLNFTSNFFTPDGVQYTVGLNRRPPLQLSGERKQNATREDILIEQSLVEKAQQGDAYAVGKLYEIHGTTVRRLLVRILGPGEYVDDLLQDVFVQVLQSVHAFRGDCRFATWLHRMTANIALSWLRKKTRKPVFQGEVAYPPVPATQYTVTTTRAELLELYAILNTLSPKRRIAFVLFEIEGCTISEIAEMTGSNGPTVKSRIFFARRDMMKKAATSAVLRELMVVPPKPSGRKPGE